MQKRLQCAIIMIAVTTLLATLPEIGATQCILMMMFGLVLAELLAGREGR